MKEPAVEELIALLKEARQGDEQCWHEFVHRYGQAAKVIVSRLRSRDEEPSPEGDLELAALELLESLRRSDQNETVDERRCFQ